MAESSGQPHTTLNQGMAARMTAVAAVTERLGSQFFPNEARWGDAQQCSLSDVCNAAACVQPVLYHPK